MLSGNDLRQLFKAILEAPYGRSLLEAANRLDQQDRNLNEILELIKRVKVDYSQRSERVLSGSDQVSRAKVENNLKMFRMALDGLGNMIEEAAAKARPSDASAPHTLDQPGASQETSPHTTTSPALVQSVVGDFGTVIQLVNASRLTQKGRIVVHVSDVSAGLNSARREFEMGNCDDARKSVQQLLNTNEKRIRDWENQARQREAQGSEMSMSERDKMHAEHHGVRNRYRMAQTQFRRLLTAVADAE